MTNLLQARPPLLYPLVGPHGHAICRGSDGTVMQQGSVPLPTPRIMLLRDADRPEIGFLLAEDQGEIRLTHQTGARPFRVVWLNAAGNPERLALREPIANLMLSASPDGAELDARTTWVAEWEEFSLDAPVATPTALRQCTALCRAIVRALDDPASGVALMLRVDARHAGAALEALLLLQDEHGAAQFVQGLMAASIDQVDMTPWPEKLTDEPWLANAIRALHDRNANHVRRVGPEYDSLGHGQDLTSFSRMSPAHRFLRHARAAVVPSRTLCLIATARDEGVSILEWVAHHRVIGVEHIFLYTNTLSDGSEALLLALAQAGLITWLDHTPGEDAGCINMQRKAYAHALSILPDTLDYAWTLALDLDEFLLPNAFWDHDIRPVLRAAASSRADALGFPWQVFYPGQQLAHADHLMGLRYTRSGAHPLIKSAFRTNRFAFADAHHPYPYPDAARLWATGDHMPHDGERPMLHTGVRNGIVCHYALRSLEEFVWKYARGENDGTGVRLEKSFRVRDPSVISHYLDGHLNDHGNPDPRYAAIAPAVQAGRDRILALPGIAEAHAHLLNVFRSQIGALVRQSRTYVAALDGLPLEDKAKWDALTTRWEASQPS